MRKVIMLNRVSIDGMFASLNEKNFGMDWFVPDPEVENYVHTLGNPGSPAPDNLLLGAATFRGFEAAWVPFLSTPQAPAPLRAIAEELTKMVKVVFSHNLSQSTWANTRVTSQSPVDFVRRLKAEPGANIMIMGSGTIVQPLSGAGLIDDYVFIVTPVIAGAGKPLFPGVSQQKLRFVESKAFASGNVVLHYEGVAQ
jgi:dihydrofolate reductase